MAIRKRKLIKRYPLPMIRRERVADKWNRSESYNFEFYAAEYCTLQNLTLKDIKVLPEGLSSDFTYTLYSNSNISCAIDGTEDLGNSIYIPPTIMGVNGNTNNTSHLGGWYTVVSVPSVWINGTVEHTKAYLTKDTTLLNTSGQEAYPTIASDYIDSLLLDKDGLVNEDWLVGWEAFNTNDFTSVQEVIEYLEGL